MASDAEKASQVKAHQIEMHRDQIEMQCTSQPAIAQTASRPIKKDSSLNG